MKFLVVCEVDHFIRQRMILPTTPRYSHAVDSDIHMNKGYVSRLLLKWNECSYVALSSYLNLLSVIKACSSFWYTTWDAMWFVFCAVIVLATVIRTKMLVCSTHIAIVISICTERIQPQRLNSKNKKVSQAIHITTHTVLYCYYTFSIWSYLL